MSTPSTSSPTTSRRSPLHAEHERLGASFTDFGGWSMPLKYGSDLAEHHAVRGAAGLFDLSHMGEVQVSGPQAAALLDHALVSLISTIAVGQAKYSLVCTPDGGVLDDLVVYRRGGQDFLVVPNAANADAVVAALAERAAGFDADVRDVGASTALIAVQGPAAASVLRSVVAPDDRERVGALRNYRAADAVLDTVAEGGGAVPALVARTGYTGEDGFEVFTDAERAVAVWRALLEAGSDAGLVPSGLACRDWLRLEAGMPLYGHELSLDVDPFAAGLGRVVALDKPGGFVGRDALAARAAQAPTRVLVGLRGAGRRAARAGHRVLAIGPADGPSVGEAVVGEVTSGVLSPTLGYPVAMAYVEAARAAPGTALGVDVRGTAQPFEVVALPFYRRPR